MNNLKTARRALGIGALLFTTSAGHLFAATDVVLHAKGATRIAGAWSFVSDATAADGVRLANPDAGQAKVASAAVSPASYFEMTFTVETGRPYHLWIRGKAQNNSWENDSAFVQFSGSQTSAASAIYRIGTTSAAVYSLEEASGLGESGWGWQDNGYGLLGDNIYFNSTTQTIRVQVREDGLSIDQILLSPVTYLTKAPGVAKNDGTLLPATTTTTTTTSTAPITWTSIVKAIATGATLKKTGPCGDCGDAGAVSQQTFASGSIAFTVAAGSCAVVGLGRDASTNTSYAFDYAFSFSGTGAWEIRELGVYRTDGTGTASDVFTVAIEGTTVKYYRNGALVYTSKTAVTSALVVDSTLVSLGATVTIVSASAATTPPPAPAPAPAPPPAPVPPPVTTTGRALRVLQYNIHHGGFGTDGIYDTNRVATWMAKMQPDVVMVNEVEKFTSWGNQDQPEVYKALLQSKTGKTWYYVSAQEFGQWSANGKTNVIFSTVPFEYVNRHLLLHNADRSIAEGVITWNGVRITLVSTHLDPYDATLRLAQALEVTAWAAPEPENKIFTGDMNAWPDQASIGLLNTAFYDSWTVALSKGTALAFSGNTGETKSGRIDYIFYSKGSRNLTVTSSRVYDTRDANGIMPSDHRPVLTEFLVK